MYGLRNKLVCLLAHAIVFVQDSMFVQAKKH